MQQIKERVAASGISSGRVSLTYPRFLTEIIQVPTPAAQRPARPTPAAQRPARPPPRPYPQRAYIRVLHEAEKVQCLRSGTRSLTD